MNTLVLLAILLVYRILPHAIETLSALSMAREVIQRGFLAEGQEVIAKSQERFSEVWPAWCHFQLPFLKLAVLVWIDNEVLKVWPWLWPIWLGPKIAVQKRVFRKTMDFWWRR